MKFNFGSTTQLQLVVDESTNQHLSSFSISKNTPPPRTLQQPPPPPQTILGVIFSGYHTSHTSGGSIIPILWWVLCSGKPKKEWFITSKFMAIPDQLETLEWHHLVLYLYLLRTMLAWAGSIALSTTKNETVVVSTAGSTPDVITECSYYLDSPGI